MVYFASALGRSYTWSSLPFLNPALVISGSPSTYNLHWVHETMEGNLRLHYFVKQNQGDELPDIAGYRVASASYKIVYITGTLMANLPDHIDKKDQNAMAKYLGVVSRGW